MTAIDLQPSASVHLRNVVPGDLPRMFAMQLDPESNRLAVMRPRNAEEFDRHWNMLFQDPTIIAKVILLDETLVGYLGCFDRDGEKNVGYWIDREFWGQGIATQALKLLLKEVSARPMVARVATSNLPSLRVLQKCGFVIESTELAPASDRYPKCEEAIMVLRNAQG